MGQSVPPFATKLTVFVGILPSGPETFNWQPVAAAIRVKVVCHIPVSGSAKTIVLASMFLPVESSTTALVGGLVM